MTPSSVLKKTSPNGKLTLYLRCRDFASATESIDGVIDIDTSYLKHRKVFGQLIAHFRFGREKDEVMGLKFHRDFCLVSTQIFPSCTESQKLTDTQMALTEKLTNHNVYPFTFYFPTTAPTSVSLQLASKEEHCEACGIYYYVKVFVGEHEGDIPHRRSSVKLNIRRIQYAPSDLIRNPIYITAEHHLVICPGNIELEVSLDKTIYESEETMPVHITVQNNSNKLIRKIGVGLYQNVSIQMLQIGQYKRLLDEYISRQGCPIKPGSTCQIILNMKPSLAGKIGKSGIALNGHHKREKCNLAPSTFLHNDPVKDAFGIIVNYYLRVKLDLGKMNRNVITIVPFILMPINEN